MAPAQPRARARPSRRSAARNSGDTRVRRPPQLRALGAPPLAAIALAAAHPKYFTSTPGAGFSGSPHAQALAPFGGTPARHLGARPSARSPSAGPGRAVGGTGAASGVFTLCSAPRSLCSPGRMDSGLRRSSAFDWRGRALDAALGRAGPLGGAWTKPATLGLSRARGPGALLGARSKRNPV